MEDRNIKSLDQPNNRKIWRISTVAIRIAVFVVAIVVVISAAIQFNTSNRERIAHLNSSQVKDGTERLSKEVANMISDRLANIRILSEFYSKSLTSPEVDVGLLQEMTENSNFDFMEFTDAEGMDHNITGGVSDARDRQYYIDGMKGNTGLELIFESRATHETLLMFYTPVVFNDEPIGVMIGVIQATGKIAELIKVSYYSKIAEVYLCDDKGDIIACNIPLNILDTRKQKSIKDVLTSKEAVKAIDATIANGGTNVFEEGSTDSSIGCSTKIDGCGWTLVEVFPNAVHNDLVNDSTRISVRLQITLIVVSAAVIAVIIITNIIDRSS